jgi:hypothetical protein
MHKQYFVNQKRPVLGKSVSTTFVTDAPACILRRENNTIIRNQLGYTPTLCSTSLSMPTHESMQPDGCMSVRENYFSAKLEEKRCEKATKGSPQHFSPLVWNDNMISFFLSFIL